MLRKFVTISGIMMLAAAMLPADFSYQETSTITGGMMASMMRVAGVFSKAAREPIQSTIAVKGDKMLHRASTHTSIIDLGSQTITGIDFQKKTYSVMTFEEMRQAMAQMAERMKKNDKGEINFKVSADATGKTRQVGGVEAKEMVLKMEMQGQDKESGQKGGMTVTTDMWLAPGVPGYREVRDFYRRMSEQIAWAPGGNMFMAYPDVAKGMAEVYKEISKVDGMPVLQTVTMTAAGESAGQSGAAPSGNTTAQPQQEKPSLGGALGGALGGRFGLGKKKSQPAESSPAAAGNTTASASLLEMNTELSGFSSNAVSDADFAIPAGFRKVEPEMKRMK